MKRKKLISKRKRECASHHAVQTVADKPRLQSSDEYMISYYELKSKFWIIGPEKQPIPAKQAAFGTNFVERSYVSCYGWAAIRKKSKVAHHQLVPSKSVDKFSKLWERNQLELTTLQLKFIHLMPLLAVSLTTEALRPESYQKRAHKKMNAGKLLWNLDQCELLKNIYRSTSRQHRRLIDVRHSGWECLPMVALRHSCCIAVPVYLFKTKQKNKARFHWRLPK